MAEETKEEARDDAEAGQKLDKILAHLDSLNSRMDALESGEEKADGEGDPDERDDAEEGEDPVDPKQVAADEDAMEKADAARKDAMRARRDAATIRDRIDAVEKMLPKQLSDADYAAMADAQAKADSVFSAFGDSAPRPLQGEDLNAYRRRMATALKAHSPAWKATNLSAIKDAAAFDVIEGQIYSDAMNTARNPADLGPGALREVQSRDSTGRVISNFYGDPLAWMGTHGGQRRRLVNISKDA